MKIVTLKRPTQFKRVRGGVRFAGPLFIIEGRVRAAGGDTSGDADVSAPRFGFTITRKVGGAVVRNRVRRRLKEALRTLGDGAQPNYDYVVVASRAAHDYPFAGLQDALRDAFERLHRQADGGHQRIGSGRRKGKGRRDTARPAPQSMPETSQASGLSDALHAAPAVDETNCANGPGRR